MVKFLSHFSFISHIHTTIMSMSLWKKLLVFVAFVGLCLVERCASEKGPDSVDMKLLNLAGKPIEVFWIDTFSPVTRLQSQSKKPIRNNTDVTIHSYASHQFSVRFLKHVAGTDANFTKLNKDEVVRVTYDAAAKKLKVEQTTKYDTGVTLVRDAVKECDKSHPHNPHDCIQEKVLGFATSFQEQRDTLSKYRSELGESLSKYACADPTLNASTPLRSYEYNFLGHSYPVDVLLDSENAKIWLVSDFVTEQECNTFEAYARPNLARATVASEDGTSRISEHRKAQQAAYDFVEDIQSDPQWPLFDRIINMVNYHSKYNLRAEGQEGFTVIQYNANDEYKPHCDGSCEGDLYVKTGRVATAVLYCEVPEVGGATVFAQADVFVKPKVGQAVFFSYKGNRYGRMDDGLTEHSGCPVKVGEKWIATAWLREGVSNEKHSRDYDPTGVAILMESDVEEDLEGGNSGRGGDEL